MKTKPKLKYNGDLVEVVNGPDKRGRVVVLKSDGNLSLVREDALRPPDEARVDFWWNGDNFVIRSGDRTIAVPKDQVGGLVKKATDP